MQVHEYLAVNRYVRALKQNRKTEEQIKFLTAEYIEYIEGNKIDNLSTELEEYLKFLKEIEIEEETKRKGR